MKMNWRRRSAAAILLMFSLLAAAMFLEHPVIETSAQVEASATPSPAQFDQVAAIAKLKAQIKGRENEPASAVFKNIQTMRNSQTGRLLAVMEFGYARSLGVNCTHCHTPDNWESEDKPQKQIAREMSTMVATINKDLLKNIKNLKSEAPIVNCTTCHRGQITPAVDLPGK